MSTSLRFFREFVTSPHSVGAVAPSSRLLAERLLEGMDLEKASVVVEFGPGTGALTAAILDRLDPEVHFTAIERNEPFVRHLRARFPEATILHGSAEETPEVLRTQGHGLADSIVSGLPWASFPPPLQRRLLDAAVGALKPGGRFATFAYAGPSLLPRGRRFRALLHEYFDQVRTTPLVWRNLPPAFAYQCRRNGNARG